MQIVFLSKQTPEDFTDEASCGKYPDAPKKCPFKNCGLPITMVKNGFYRRDLITARFNGRIKIRRYKCPKCGRTVSMLPSFCLAGFTYGVDIVVGLMRKAVESGSNRKAAESYRAVAGCISRRHVALYLSRLRKNRPLIQYGFNQISPGSIHIGDPPGDIEWTRSFLLGTGSTLSPESNTEFHKATGKSFMSTQNKIA